jgi:hypothetical protein
MDTEESRTAIHGRNAVGTNKTKFVLQTMLFTCALIFFMLHVQEVAIKYYEKRTTVTIIKEPSKKLLPPALSFCTDMRHNANKLKSYGLEQLFFVVKEAEKAPPQNMTLWELYYETTFIFGKDFDLVIIDSQRTVQMEIEHKLNIGVNIVQDTVKGNYEVVVHEVNTLYYGNNNP